MSRNSDWTIDEKIKAVNDYLDGTKSISQIQADLSVKSHNTIYDWIKKYKNIGVESFLPTSRNSSYTEKFKMMVVKKYLAGEGSLSDLAIKYGIKSYSTVKKWVLLYKANKELKDYSPQKEIYMASSRRKTTFNERKEIVEYCIEHNHNFKDTAVLYDISYSQIYVWVKKFEETGEDSLIDKRGHHKKDEELDELERLRRENHRLKIKLEEKERLTELLKKVREIGRK